MRIEHPKKGARAGENYGTGTGADDDRVGLRERLDRLVERREGGGGFADVSPLNRLRRLATPQERVASKRDDEPHREKTS